MADISRLANDFNEKGTEFLKIELDTGLTLAHIAMDEEPGSVEQAKSRQNARKAYDTVLRLRSRFDIASETAVEEINQRLAQLRSVLEKLGEKVA